MFGGCYIIYQRNDKPLPVQKRNLRRVRMQTGGQVGIYEKDYKCKYD